MRAGMDKRSTQPWAADAFAALEEEQAGQFKTDEELSPIVFRELPLYFAHFGPAEAGYLDTLKSETINADALKLFNEEIFNTFDLRGSLGAITSPALVITGDEDFICGPVCAACRSCWGPAAVRWPRRSRCSSPPRWRCSLRPERPREPAGRR